MNHISQLTGEALNGHWHKYDTVTGHWRWCEKCQCMVNNECDHEKNFICCERSEYIRMKKKYEVQEYST